METYTDSRVSYLIQTFVKKKKKQSYEITAKFI